MLSEFVGIHSINWSGPHKPLLIPVFSRLPDHIGLDLTVFLLFCLLLRILGRTIFFNLPFSENLFMLTILSFSLKRLLSFNTLQLRDSSLALLSAPLVKSWRAPPHAWNGRQGRRCSQGRAGAEQRAKEEINKWEIIYSCKNIILLLATCVIDISKVIIYWSLCTITGAVTLWCPLQHFSEPMGTRGMGQNVRSSAVCSNARY